MVSVRGTRAARNWTLDDNFTGILGQIGENEDRQVRSEGAGGGNRPSAMVPEPEKDTGW